MDLSGGGGNTPPVSPSQGLIQVEPAPPKLVVEVVEELQQEVQIKSGGGAGVTRSRRKWFSKFFLQVLLQEQVEEVVELPSGYWRNRWSWWWWRWW